MRETPDCKFYHPLTQHEARLESSITGLRADAGIARGTSLVALYRILQFGRVSRKRVYVTVPIFGCRASLEIAVNFWDPKVIRHFSASKSRFVVHDKIAKISKISTKNQRLSRISNSNPRLNGIGTKNRKKSRELDQLLSIVGKIERCSLLAALIILLTNIILQG